MMIHKISIKDKKPNNWFQVCGVYCNEKVLNNEKKIELQCPTHKRYLSQSPKIDSQIKMKQQSNIQKIVQNGRTQKISISKMLKASASHKKFISNQIDFAHFNQLKKSKKSIIQLKKMKSTNKIKLGEHLQTCVSIDNFK